jgi:hypothetical protein
MHGHEESATAADDQDKLIFIKKELQQIRKIMS